MSVEDDIANLEAAIASGEKRVRIGDRDVEYRDVSELKAALAYKKGQLPNAGAGSITYVGFKRE